MKKIVLLLLIAFLCMAFVPVTPEESAKNNAAVEIAIKDFLKTRSSKKSRVFSIYFGDVSDDVIAFSISSSPDKFYLDPEVDTIGRKFSLRRNNSTPTRYVIRNKKLFYWGDPNYGLTQEFIAVLSAYNHLDTLTLENGPVITLDERKKGWHYYFCKNNLSIYKPVFSRFAIGWYDPPRLRCVNSSGEKMPVEYKQPKPFSVQ